MKIPFIKVNQKGETFFICKMNAKDLKEHINFEFRDPYFDYKSQKDRFNDEKRVELLQRKGLNIQINNKSAQRKLQLDKIQSIKKFLEENETNFFPNSILLSLNIVEDEDNEIIQILESKESGEITLYGNNKFNIIDGQHRLAGIFASDKNILDNFEIAVVLLVDVSVSYATKIFLDINENQKSVNKSLVYDLYGSIDDESINDIRKIHMICEKLYKNKNSPLYKQIKMLGVGSGAISQAFFIDSVLEALKECNLDKLSAQEIYSELFTYFRAYQKVFQSDWPVLLDENRKEENEYISDEEYAEKVLKIHKSQLVKTTGFGGIMKAFPYIYERKKGGHSYLQIIKQLKDKIDWKKSYGTGKKAQGLIKKEIIGYLEIDN